MRKFIKTLVIYSFIIATLVGIVNYFYAPLDKRNPNYTQKFEDVPEHIELCNLGSSHGLYGYNYEKYNDTYTCFNFALNSQTLSYDARILEHYKEHIEEGAIVFVTVSFNSFFGIPETETAEFETKNMRYYDFLPNNLIKDYSVTSDLLTTFSCLLAYDTLPDVLSGNYTTPDTELPGWYGSAADMDMSANTTLTLQRHLVEGKLDAEGNRFYNQEEIDALYRIIEICESIGATPVLITPPYSLVYNYSMDLDYPEVFEQFDKVINDVTSKTGVAYYDYSRHPYFMNDFMYFKDTDHLNFFGAELFTNILMEEVVAPIWQE